MENKVELEFIDQVRPLRSVTPVHTLGVEIRLNELLRTIDKIIKLNDTDPILEFGCGGGYSISSMAKYIIKYNAFNKLYGFDSFAGLPRDEGPWQKGWFSFSLDHVKNTIHGLESIITLIPGIYEESLTNELKEKLNKEIKRASVISIDCDLYSSTVTALNFCKDWIKDGTFIVFDEWHGGEREAWEEFVKDNNINYFKILPGAEQHIVRVV